MALGVMPGLSISSRRSHLHPEDTLFFYTDGITEAFDPAGNMFSEQRLMDVLYESRDLSVEALGRQRHRRCRELCQRGAAIGRHHLRRGAIRATRRKGAGRVSAGR